MRILHIAPYFARDAAYGGPITVAMTQVRQLAAAGHDVELWMGWDGIAEPPPLGRVTCRLFPARVWSPRIGFATLSSLPLLRAVKRDARKFDAVHIHVARDLLTLPAIRLTISSGAFLVAQPHGMIARKSGLAARLIDRAITVPWLQGVQRLIALSTRESEGLADLTNTPAQVLHNTVDLPAGSARRDGEEDGLVVVFLGRLHPRKRVMLLAEAARLLLPQFNFRVEIYGPDEGDATALNSFIEQQELHDRIRYNGAVEYSERQAILEKASIFAFPSQNEPWGMSLAEAMAAGLPCVGTPGSDLAIDASRTHAAIIGGDTPEQFAHALASLLLSADLRRSVGDAARHYAKTRFVSDGLEAALLRIYNPAFPPEEPQPSTRHPTRE